MVFELLLFIIIKNDNRPQHPSCERDTRATIPTLLEYFTFQTAQYKDSKGFVSQKLNLPPSLLPCSLSGSMYL